jgi:hypothetical protein
MLKGTITVSWSHEAYLNSEFTFVNLTNKEHKKLSFVIAKDDTTSEVYSLTAYGEDFNRTNSGLVDCIEQSYTWSNIFNDERYENPRTDAPMWMHEELHELTEFMHTVRNLLLLAELLPIEYTAEMQVSLQAFRNEDWLYKQFEKVLNS